MMTMSESIRACTRNYATFSGRACRAEFWWWTVFCWLVGVMAWALKSLTPVIGNAFELLTALGLFLPSLAVQWRRLHDVGCPGYTCLLPVLLPAVLGALGVFVLGASDALFSLVFIAGLSLAVWLLYLNIRRGDAVSNAYGPPPVHGS